MLKPANFGRLCWKYMYLSNMVELWWKLAKIRVFATSVSRLLFPYHAVIYTLTLINEGLYGMDEKRWSVCTKCEVIWVLTVFTIAFAISAASKLIITILKYFQYGFPYMLETTWVSRISCNPIHSSTCICTLQFKQVYPENNGYQILFDLLYFLRSPVFGGNRVRPGQTPDL